MSSVISNSSGESEEFLRKRTLTAANLSTEEIEPYVRHKRANLSSDYHIKKRAENLSEEEQNLLRTCINSRERRRMHDLNDALDDLRRYIPHSDNMRKLSKISTIILATNRIQQLGSTVEQLVTENNKLRQQLGIPTVPNPITLPDTLTMKTKNERQTPQASIQDTATLPSANAKMTGVEKCLPIQAQQLTPIAFLPPLVAATLQSMAMINARNALQQQQHQLQEHRFSPNGLAEIAALRFTQALRLANSNQTQNAFTAMQSSQISNNCDNDDNNNVKNDTEVSVCQKCCLFPTASSNDTTATGAASCLCVSCILSGRDAVDITSKITDPQLQDNDTRKRIQQ